MKFCEVKKANGFAVTSILFNIHQCCACCFTQEFPPLACVLISVSQPLKLLSAMLILLCST